MAGKPWEEDVHLLASLSEEHLPRANFSPKGSKEPGSGDALGLVEHNPDPWWTHLGS